jgi:hypothetical protein
MGVPRLYVGANVRLENNLGLASLKMPVKAVMHVMLSVDYENSCPSIFLLTPSSGGRVGSKLGSDQTFIPFAVKGYLQLAPPVLCTTLIMQSDS